MAFGVSSVAKNEGSAKKEVDYNAMNKHVVETANLLQPETLVGYVSAIVDLGEQDQPDAEYVFEGNAEAEAAEIEKNPNTYFEDGIDEKTKKKVRLKCWPQRPIQSVAVAVDFPDIIVDKGQFFGTSNPQPLRLWLGGQFYIHDVGMVIGRPTPLKITKATGAWSFDKKHLFHKMAVTSKLITPDDVFLPQQIDQLLGKAFQFQAHVYFKENKGKQYYTENIKFIGGLGRGQAQPEIISDLVLIQFNEENDETSLGSLRNHVLNTIRRAKNFEGSKLQAQLEAKGFDSKATPSEDQPEDKPVSKVTPAKVKAKVTEVPEEDEDIPF